MELIGKRALVTGGAGGIGRELVSRLLDAGTQVAVLDIIPQIPESIRRPGVHYVACDLTEYSQAERAIAAVFEIFDEIDILVNNAGMTEDQPLVNLVSGIKKHDVDTWHRVIAGTLHQVFYVTVNVAARMVEKRTKGVIVNVSSVAAGGNAGQTAYSAGKAGVDALTKTWARELNLLGIRVAGVAPGFTKTKIVESMGEKVIASWNKRIPLRRMAEPAEIADGIVFVIKNDYFNGKILELDGGLIV